MDKREVIIIPHENDVLIGRGYYYVHPGNIIYRNYVYSLKQQYKHEIKGHKAKAEFCYRIVQHLKEKNAAQFLTYDDTKGGWVRVDDDTMVKKIQILIRHNRSFMIKSTDSIQQHIIPVANKSQYKYNNIDDATPTTESSNSQPPIASRNTSAAEVTKAAPTQPQQRHSIRIRKKVMDEVNIMKVIHGETRNMPGGLQSFAVSNFLQNNPHLKGCTKDILDNLFCYDSHHPDVVGPGCVLSVDRPRGNGPYINTQRKTYVKQNFGKYTHKITNNPRTQHVYTYGTGSGTTTHGTPQR